MSQIEYIVDNVILQWALDILWYNIFSVIHLNFGISSICLKYFFNPNHCLNYSACQLGEPRDHSGYGHSHWEMSLHSDVISNWLSPYPEWTLWAVASLVATNKHVHFKNSYSHIHVETISYICLKYRDHFVHVPGQWETTLHCNVNISHWLDAYIKWSLEYSLLLSTTTEDLVHGGINLSALCWEKLIGEIKPDYVEFSAS